MQKMGVYSAHTSWFVETILENRCRNGKIVIRKDDDESAYKLNGTFERWKDNIGAGNYSMPPLLGYCSQPEE